jgi:hypothetical protein
MGTSISAFETNLNLKAVESWDRVSVKEWLNQLALKKEKDIFFKNNIDGKSLLEMNEEKLQEIGIKDQNSIERIMECIRQLKIIYEERNLSEMELQDIEKCLKKVERLAGVASWSKEKKLERAKKSVVKKYFIESFLNRELVATRQVLNDLIEDDGMEDMQEVDESLLEELKSEKKRFKMILGELSQIESSEKQMSERQLKGPTRTKKREEFLKVKLVVTELAMSTTFRKVLSPIMDAFDKLGQFGIFHTALIIGPWYIEWNDSGIITPRRSYSANALIAADLNKVFTGDEINDVVDKMADLMCYWNANVEYNTKTRNCQHFVDELCAKLGIELNFTGALGDYLDHARKHGVCDLKFAVSPDLQKVLGITDKYKTFANHRELDAFVIAIKEKDKMYFERYEGDWVLLKSFDRAFWLRYFKSPSNEKWAPESVNDSTFKTSCPFQHPNNTASIVGTS